MLVTSVKSPAQENITTKDDEITKESKIKALIIENFNKYDELYLIPYDSCVYLKYIQNDFKPLEQQEYQVFYGLEIFTETCPYTNFHFAILKRMEDEKFSYYGLADIYYLKYSESLARGQIITFKNDALNKLINEMKIASASTEKREVTLKLRKFLYYLYHETHDKLNKPSFMDRSTIGFVVNEYYDGIKKSKLESEFLNADWDDFIVFENERLGLIIFKISSPENSIKIQEFLIPSKTKYKFYKPEGSSIPDEYWRSCR